MIHLNFTLRNSFWNNCWINYEDSQEVTGLYGKYRSGNTGNENEH